MRLMLLASKASLQMTLQESWDVFIEIAGSTKLRKPEQNSEIRSRVAIRATIYRSLRALRARNPKKVSKRVFLGVCKKVPENTRKSQKIPEKYPNLDFFGCFSTFSGIFGDFFADPQKDSFRDFFGISGPESPETPVSGRSDRNSREQRANRTGSQVFRVLFSCSPPHP